MTVPGNPYRCSYVQGFGCTVLAHDIRPSEELRALGVGYVSKEELLQRADVVSLHCPLLPSTYHIIDAARWAHLLRVSFLLLYD